MGIVTTTFIRKPLYVEAVRITGANFDDIVAWCQGEVTQDDVPGKGKGKKYIKVRVHNPKNPRQTKAFVGDWLLKTERGYKVYTNKAFHESFHTVEKDHRSIEDAAIARGQEELEKQRGEGLISGSEEIVPGVTVSDAVRQLRAHADMQAAVGPDVELVPATPAAIAEAVKENSRHLGTEGDGTDEQPSGVINVAEANPHIAQGRVEDKIAEAAEPTPAKPTVVTEPTVEVDGGVQLNDSNSAPPPTHDGKRVLTLKEQGEMDSDEIRDLLKSGEVVLAQDIAA